MVKTRDNPENGSTLIPIVEDQVSTRKTLRATGKVRVRTGVHEEDQPVTADLQSQEVEIERTPRDEFVDDPIPDRQDGDTTVISVVEEVAVVEKRLKLVEEVRITRRTVTRPWQGAVTVRRNEVLVERHDEPDAPEDE